MLLQLSQPRFQRRLATAITLPIALLLLLAGVSIAQVTRLINALDWIEHTDQVISRANYTQKLLLDVETGFRGYLLTGDPDFLEPYQQASVITEDSFEELQRLVSDNERQQQRIEQLEAQYEEWTSLIRPAIERRQRGETEPPALLGLRKQKMDAMRWQISEFIATEEELRNERSQRAQQTTRTVIASSLLLSLGIGSLLAYFILGISRSYKTALGGQLQAHAAELEQRVEERTTRLQELNQELEAFAYSVSHDLRAPLRAMESFAQALVEDYGDQINSEGRDYITAIIEASVRMEALISDLLAYSHVTRQEVSVQPTSLAAVVQDALRQLESPIKEHQAQIVIGSALPEVMAQHSALLQVVANLVSNAIKFVPPETVPRIEIYAEAIEQEPHNRVRLWVADNGIGIAPEDHKRIFRVFERLHGHKSYAGNGIGLAIVRAAIERMGGEIGVESELGHGSRFWIALPKADSHLP